MIHKLGLGLGLGLGGKHGQSNAKFYDDTLNILWAGQSNANRMFADYSGAGNTAFETVLSPHYTTVNSINGAVNGCAIHKDADFGSGYYWDPDTGLPGQELLDALTAVDNAAINRSDVDIVVICHGETDAEAIESGTITAQESKDALNAYIQYLRQQLSNPLILLTPIGADTNGNSFSGWAQMREMQWELWTEYFYIQENPGYYDQPMQDDVHLNQSGYEAFGQRTARRILGLFGKISPAGTLGPKIASATFDPANELCVVTIEHDGGTDFTLYEKKGLSIEQNGTALGTSSVARLTSTTFEIRTTTDLQTGDVIKPIWIYGTLKSYTQNNILIDNASNPMPLRCEFGVIAVEI